MTATATCKAGRWYFGAQVGITGSDPAPHELAAVTFGGRVNSHEPNGLRLGHKRQYHWQRGGKRAVPAIEAVLPYLRIKADRARLVLDLQEHVDQGFPWMPCDFDPAPSLLAMVREIREGHAPPTDFVHWTGGPVSARGPTCGAGCVGPL